MWILIIYWNWIIRVRIKLKKLNNNLIIKYYNKKNEILWLKIKLTYGKLNILVY